MPHLPEPLVRHLTGDYLHLPNAFGREDVIYWMSQQPKQTIDVFQLRKVCGTEDNLYRAESAIQQLVSEGLIKIEPGRGKPDRLTLLMDSPE